MKTPRIDRGMLLLDRDYNGRPVIWAALSKTTLAAHHGSISVKVTLTDKTGKLPDGWTILNNQELAVELAARKADQ